MPTIRRYSVHEPIARGGMATVYLGRIVGDGGFSRVVAIKQMHPHLASQPDFVARFIDEARLSSRVRHMNVVQTIDVVASSSGVADLLLVMEYVHGESLSRIVKLARERGERMPAEVAASIIVGALHGLHAAHEARSEGGAPLDLVHRDVSPQNVLVGADGVAKLTDFGVARATERLHATKTNSVPGKLRYMAPEQIMAEPLDRRADLWACGVVLWELLAGRPLFQANDAEALIGIIRRNEIPALPASVPTALAEVVERALARVATDRPATAREMAIAIGAAIEVASTSRVGAWVESVASESLAELASVAALVEQSAPAEDPTTTPDVPPVPPASEGATDISHTIVNGSGERVFDDPELREVAARPRRSPLVIAAAAVAVLATLGGVVLAGARRDASRAAIAPPATPSPASAELSGEPSSSEPELPAPSPQLDRPPTSSGRAPARPPRVRRAAPGQGCDPPFFVDARGTKIYKVECL